MYFEANQVEGWTEALSFTTYEGHADPQLLCWDVFAKQVIQSFQR